MTRKKKVSPHYREETDAKEPTMSMQGLSLPVAHEARSLRPAAGGAIWSTHQEKSNTRSPICKDGIGAAMIAV